MSHKGTKPKAVCVLGMHRSGTSVITRAVNLLGAYVGEETDLMPPTQDNPRGYWERQDIADLNDEILGTLGRLWDTSLPLPEGWHRSEKMRPLKAQAASLLKRTFSDCPLWAWKDPRSTLLFDLWKEVICELGTELVCLFVVRNPLDVARSHQKRDGFTLDKGFGLWFNCNLAALHSSRRLKTAFISYDRFLVGWEAELRKCAEELGIEWPEDDRVLREKMAEFITLDLKHSCSDIEVLVEAGAPSPVIELCKLLEQLVAGRDRLDKNLIDRREKLSAEFLSYSRFFYDDQGSLFQAKNKQLALEYRLAEKEQQLAEVNHRLEVLLNSKCWKITAPFRSILDMIKR